MPGEAEGKSVLALSLTRAATCRYCPTSLPTSQLWYRTSLPSLPRQIFSWLILQVLTKSLFLEKQTLNFPNNGCMVMLVLLMSSAPWLPAKWAPHLRFLEHDTLQPLFHGWATYTRPGKCLHAGLLFWGYRGPQTVQPCCLQKVPHSEGLLFELPSSWPTTADGRRGSVLTFLQFSAHCNSGLTLLHMLFHCFSMLRCSLHADIFTQVPAVRILAIFMTGEVICLWWYMSVVPLKVHLSYQFTVMSVSSFPDRESSGVIIASPDLSQSSCWLPTLCQWASGSVHWQCRV